MKLGEEAAAREVAERAAEEAREALASMGAAAEAREAEHQAEVDASRAAWEAERPRLEDAQAQLQEVKVQLEVCAYLEACSGICRALLMHFHAQHGNHTISTT